MKISKFDCCGGCSLFFCAAVFVLVLGYEAAVAIKTPTRPFNEPLWYMRGCVPPTDLSTAAYRAWAVDMPVLNRWAYWPVLKATGLDRVPAGEKPAWEIRDRELYFEGDLIENGWRSTTPKEENNIQNLEAFRGRYAPRNGILAERGVNLAVFAALILILWLTARLILKSDILAALAVLPLCLVRFWSEELAFVSMQGDVFFLAGAALALLLWTRFHLEGQGTAWKSTLVVGVAAGIATSGKHPGILVLMAFCVYLLWQARGWGRILKPTVACVAAFAVFAIVNPAVWAYPGTQPWDVLSMMVTHRGVVEANAWIQSGGRPTLRDALHEATFWLPLAPVALAALWAVERERWLVPVALWGAFIVIGTTAGILQTRHFVARYFVPIEMGLYFPLALAALALAAERLRRDGAPAGG